MTTPLNVIKIVSFSAWSKSIYNFNESWWGRSARYAMQWIISRPETSCPKLAESSFVIDWSRVCTYQLVVGSNKYGGQTAVWGQLPVEFVIKIMAGKAKRQGKLVRTDFEQMHNMFGWFRSNVIGAKVLFSCCKRWQVSLQVRDKVMSLGIWKQNVRHKTQ